MQALTTTFKRLTAQALLTLAGLGGFCVDVIHAHGVDDGWHAPSLEGQGLARGLELARACDNAIHELLDEHHNCLRYWHEQLGADPASHLAFWWHARLRAQGAGRNGYADAAEFGRRYDEAFNAARAQIAEPQRTLLEQQLSDLTAGHP